MTAPIDLQLKETTPGGITSNLDGTGMTVQDLLVTSIFGQVVNTSGKFAWLSQVGGTVQFSPSATDLRADLSPYLVTVVLQDGAGKLRPYPDAEATQIRVRKARG
jgi:hypothetical protein